jgi:hypothetical protein
MPDDRTWTWYVGILQGWGDCIWQGETAGDGFEGTLHLRYIARVLMTQKGPQLMRVPFGCAKGADVTIHRDKIVACAAAAQDAIDGAMECYGMKTIIAASAGDLDKAPKLTLVK